jgi:hypothetical protein
MGGFCWSGCGWWGAHVARMEQRLAARESRSEYQHLLRAARGCVRRIFRRQHRIFTRGHFTPLVAARTHPDLYSQVVVETIGNIVGASATTDGCAHGD